MANAVIRDSHLTFNGIKYYRGNAEEIELGSYGEKRTPLFGMNYLEVFKNLAPEKLKIKDAIAIEVDTSSLHESDVSVGAGFKILGVGGAIAASNLLSKFKSAEVKLVKLSIDRGDVVDAINASTSVRDQIDNLGTNARFTHQVFVVVEARLAQTITSATAIKASAEKGDVKLELSVAAGGQSSTTVVLAEGTTFAYLLADLKWDHASQRKRTRIVSASDDQWGVS